MKNNTKLGREHQASARATNLFISTKQGVEISRNLRFKKTGLAKKFLEDVINLRKAVPFKRYIRDVGHKKGIAAGRYPQKAAQEFMKLIKSAEANAQAKGLNTADLKIIQLLANKASIPLTGGRQRYGTKRTHLEIVVKEISKGGKKKLEEKKAEAKPAEIKNEDKQVEVNTTKTQKSQIEEKPITKVKKKFDEVPYEVPDVKEEPAEDQLEEEIIKGKKKLPNDTERQKKPTEIKTTKTGLQFEKELSSAELLKRAQAKAAELNNQEKIKKDVEEVSKLYDKLKQKGTLRKGQ